MMSSWSSKLDVWTLLLWVALVCVGLAAIYSSTNGPASEFLLESVRQSFSRQLMWLGVATVVFAVLVMLPLRFYQSGAYPIYGVMLLLLVATLFFGTEING